MTRAKLLLVSALFALVAAVLIGRGAASTAGAADPTPGLTIGVDVVTGSATEVTYRIVAANRLDGVARNVVVSNAVPANTKFARSVPPPSAGADGSPSCVPGAATATCSWSVGDLAAGRSATIDVTFELLPQAAQGTRTVASTATASGSDGLTASNTDSTVQQTLLGTGLADTYVDDRATQSTVNGNCPDLRIRRDDSMTAFIRTFTQQDSFPVIADLFAARLTAFVKTADATAPAAQIAAHHIDAVQWDAPSTSPCGSTTSDGSAPRTGWTPPSAATPTDVATASGAGTPSLTWDVTADLDTPDDRTADAGWELIDAAAGSGETVTELHSRQALNAPTGPGEAGRPRLALTYTVPEPPTCIEVRPQALAASSPDEAILTARLTDGSAAQQGQLCNGAPTPEEPVGLKVTDDDPDVYVSSLNGRPVSVSANAGVARIDPQTGSAAFGLRLMQPEYGTGDLGDNALTAQWAFTCTPGGSVSDFVQATRDNACPESVPARDVGLHWTRGPQPATPPPPPPPPAGEDGVAVEDGVAALAAAPAVRTVKAALSRTQARWGRALMVSGELTSADASCVGDQRVEVWRRYPDGAWQAVARSRTSAGGHFTLETVVTRTAQYFAAARPTEACVGASSEPVAVRSKPLIELDASRREPRTGRRVTLFGRVMPAAPGRRVIVERRKARRWVRVARPKLDSRSRFRLPVRVNWAGSRVFRVRSRASADRAPGKSAKLVIAARR